VESTACRINKASKVIVDDEIERLSVAKSEQFTSRSGFQSLRIVLFESQTTVGVLTVPFSSKEIRA